MALMVLLMVFFSGFTGLIYQVTWQKYLSIYLGSHALSTSLTLACFFLFLALGYHVAGRYSHKFSKNRILTYAYIEGIIGAYAIVSPQLFDLIFSLWPNYPSNTFAHFLSSSCFAFLLMGLPTFLMGSTIPLLTQGMSRKLEQSHKVHAWVYGINTLGAFLGTVLAGFYLLETFGLAQSLNLTGMVNCLLCVFLIIYCKKSRHTFEGYSPKKTTIKHSPASKLLAVGFISGFLSFGLESLLIRMASLSIGSTNYSYTIIVSTFILSIAIGSVLSSRADEKNGHKWLIASQLALIFAIGTLALLIPKWPDLFLRVRLLFSTSEINFAPYQIVVFLCFLFMLLIPVTLMGMTLPLLFQQLKRQGLYLSQVAGRMYAYNSLGAALGACLLGYLAFFVFTAQQVTHALIILASINCTLLLLITVKKSNLIIKLTPIFIGALIVLIIPQWNDHNFVPGRFFSTNPPKKKEQMLGFLKKITDTDNNRILYSNYGPNTYTVVTEDLAKERVVYVNGKPDASTKVDRFTRTLTALIPLTLAESNQDIFIIGLGSGMSTGIAAGFEGTKSVQVAEIASGVIQALPFFKKWNFELEKNMDKVTITNDDAYKVFKTSQQKFNLIFSEPSNTWVTGVEKIYTQEFLQEASKKLKPKGLYSQWFPLFGTSESAFTSILYNFKTAFKHVTLWSAGGGATIILASNSPLTVDLEKIKSKSEKMKSIYSSIQRESGLDILYHQIWTDHAVTEVARGSSKQHSVYHPSLAYESARAFFASTNVKLEKLTEKYFVESSEQKAKKEALITSESLQKSGEDQLLWQKVASQLPESFFDNGSQFLKDVNPLFQGKLSLAKNSFFKDDSKLDCKEILESAENKKAQYKFLLTNDVEKIPALVNPKLTLAKELFDRYLYLLAMREQPILAKALSQVPKKCGDKKKTCLINKITILRFLNPELSQTLDPLVKRAAIKDQGAQNKIESIYTKTISNL